MLRGYVYTKPQERRPFAATFLLGGFFNLYTPVACVASRKQQKQNRRDGKSKSAGLAGVSSGMGLDDGLLVCTLLLLI